MCDDWTNDEKDQRNEPNTRTRNGCLEKANTVVLMYPPTDNNEMSYAR